MYKVGEKYQTEGGDFVTIVGECIGLYHRRLVYSEHEGRRIHRYAEVEPGVITGRKRSDNDPQSLKYPPVQEIYPS